jgi:hypothetical protein
LADREQSYEIGESAEHRTLSFFGPADEKAPQITKNFAAYEGGPEEVEKRAIWVVHGMGQQVPFETLDALAQGVLSAVPSHPRGWQIVGSPRVAAVKFLSADNPAQTQVVQRVEIRLHRPGPHFENLELHLYEAYWAPLTEGVAKLSDVTSFLYNGALHGLLNCWKPFRRAMFPEDTSPVIQPAPDEGKCAQGFWNFRIRWIVALQIIVVLKIVFALAAINAVILAASAVHLKFSFFGPWAASESWDQLTAITTALTALALTFGAVLFLAEMSEPANPPTVAHEAIHSLALKFQKLIPSHLKTRRKKTVAPKEGSSPTVDAFWAVAKKIIFYLSWISLCITAASIIVGAVFLVLIWKFDSIARYFHGMHYHATQVVSTSGILVSLLLYAYAARRSASRRSQRLDDPKVGVKQEKDGVPFFLFVFSFLLHIALVCLLLIVQIHRFSDPGKLWIGLRYLIDVLGSAYWVWPALLAVSKLVRDVIVEYAGDVAIYVAPNKLDRFDETRQKIKQLALNSLMPIYAATGTGLPGEAATAVPLYTQIAVVGHSLGSVIAYDTLNKLLMLDDLLKPNQFHVAERTAIFESFGSPLDKTAFFFSYQGTENYNIREQLAACVQPLIQNYGRFREFPWINVYSRSDIISGDLKFYDVTPPGSATPRARFPVQNFTDPDAIVPLIAHVEYWKNHIVWDKLIEKITA